MAMCTRRKRQRQASLWIPLAELPITAAHLVCQQLNQTVDAAGFDVIVETTCRSLCAPTMGRPNLALGAYFRLLSVGYVEGLDSERGIVRRAADSLAIRRLLRMGLDDAVAGRSTTPRTRQLIEVKTHGEVFLWIQQRLVDRGMLTARPLGIDGATLEANAAWRSIVCRDAEVTC